MSLSSLSGDTIVLLNSHGVQGKKMSHTQYECIREGLLSTYINIKYVKHTDRSADSTQTSIYIFFNIYTHTFTYTHIHAPTHRWKKKLPLFGLQGSVMKPSSHFKGWLISFVKKYSRKIRN